MDEKRIDLAPTNWSKQDMGMAVCQEELLEPQYNSSNKVQEGLK